MKLPSQRQLKVGENIRHIIADIFLKEKIFSRTISFNLLTVPEVRMSPDLKQARVYFTSLESNEEPLKLEKELNYLSPLIQRELSRNVRLKFMPKLRFQYDKTLDDAERMEELLDKNTPDDNSV